MRLPLTLIVLMPLVWDTFQNYYANCEVEGKRLMPNKENESRTESSSFGTQWIILREKTISSMKFEYNWNAIHFIIYTLKIVNLHYFLFLAVYSRKMRGENFTRMEETRIFSLSSGTLSNDESIGNVRKSSFETTTR